jgi:hypothetical protein
MSTSAVTSSTSLFDSPHFLRRVLWLDAISGAATGVLQLLFPGFLSSLLGLPEALLLETGWVLLAFTAGIAFLATRQFVPSAGVWLLIGANALWVLGCLALLFGGWVTPGFSGKAFIAVQAVWVGLIAELEWVGLRKASANRW